jgi:hypothetical protein
MAKEFDYQRNRAAQAENANVQAKRDALARRQAQLGGGPGGAFIKAEQNVLDESQNRLATVNEGIDAAKRSEERRIGEIENAQAFQRGEREAGQTFVAGQADLGRKFATGEREASQMFGRGEREASQLFSRGEREASQGFSKAEREAGQVFAGEQAELGRDWQSEENRLARRLQDAQWTRQFDASREDADWQRSVDNFNMNMATKMFEEKDFLEKILGNLPGMGGEKWNKAGGVVDVATGGMFNPIGLAGTVGRIGGKKRKLF